jgi:hypothetical protein
VQDLDHRVLGEGHAMAEIEYQEGKDIRCPAERIFHVIADLGGQERWLAKSVAFPGR